MNDFPGPQEADGVCHLWNILDHPENIVIGGAGFLFRRQALEKVGDGIAFGLEFAGVKGDAARRLRPYAHRMIHIVRSEAGFFNFFHGKIGGQLVYDGGNHFQVGQFFGAHICQDGHAHPVGGRETLGQIAHGSADFAVGPAVLTHDQLGDFGVGGGNVYGVL